MNPADTFDALQKAQKLYELTADPFFLSMAQRLAEILTRPPSELHLKILESQKVCWDAYLTLFPPSDK